MEPAHPPTPAGSPLLRQPGLWDSAPESSFDRLARLAARLLGVPVVVASLLEGERQLVLSAVGLREPVSGEQETPVPYPFCEEVVAAGQALFIGDVREHPLANDGRAVPGPHPVAYAGIPLRSGDGRVLGSFCAVDFHPREWTGEDISALQDLAACMEAGIALRLEVADRRASEIRYRSLFSGAQEGVPEDITAQKAAEDELREAKERLVGFLDTIPEAAWVKDSSGRYVLVNRSYVQARGRPPEEILGRRDVELFPPDLAETFVAADRRVLREGTLWFEHSIRTDGGEVRHFSISKSALPDGLGVVGVAHDVTDRKRAEEALLRREQEIRALVEHSPDMIARFDLELRHVYVNPATMRAGVTPESFLGRTHQEVAADRGIPEPLASLWTEALLRARQNAREEAIEFTWPAAQSEQHWQVRIAPILGPDGEVQGLLSVGREITLLRQTHQALWESEERARSLFDNSPVGLYRATDEGFVEVNSALVGILGYPDRETLLATPLLEFAVHPEDHAHWAQVLRREGEIRNVEAPVHRRDGSVIWIRESTRTVTDAQGRTFYDGVIEDITIRREMEEALRRSEAQLRRFFDEDISGDYLADGEGRVLDCNPAFARIFGFRSVQDATGASIPSLNLDTREYQAAWAELQREGRLESRQIQMRRVDGEIVHLLQNVVAILDAEGELSGTQGYLVDITEHMRLEERLRQASKMEAVGQLAGGVAHDFNNMLQVIRGFASLLEGTVSEEAEEYVQEIQKAATRAAALTRQLLAFGRRQMLKAEVLDLNEVVESAGGMLRRLVPANIRMEVHPAGDLGQVEADPTQLQQVLMNLVVNARDAMPEGGVLTIATATRTVGESDRGALSFIKKGEYVSLMVRDTGSGISPETLPRIFDPFFTTKVEGAGTGLGLSTVYGVVKQSNGYVWAESEPAGGTSFTVLLPRVDVARPTGTAEEGPRSHLRGSATILLAEDEDAVRALIQATLRKAGYVILQAADGEEALRLAAEYEDRIDLLLTDVIMPKMGGSELAARLRATRAGLPVVFMSGYAGDVLTQESHLPPETEFLQKPFQPAALTATVQAALAAAKGRS